MAKHNELGKQGEEIAAQYLIEKGYEIVERNWRNKHKEIDIIAKDGNEGFVNAKFVFERQKKVGDATMDNLVKWPLWIRTDVLPNEVYAKLLKK